MDPRVPGHKVCCVRSHGLGFDKCRCLPPSCKQAPPQRQLPGLLFWRRPAILDGGCVCVHVCECVRLRVHSLFVTPSLFHPRSVLAHLSLLLSFCLSRINHSAPPLLPLSQPFAKIQTYFLGTWVKDCLVMRGWGSCSLLLSLLLCLSLTHTHTDEATDSGAPFNIDKTLRSMKHSNSPDYNWL